MTTTPLDLFRVYDRDTDWIRPDGYPAEWHVMSGFHDVGPGRTYGLKDVVRDQAGNRCLRCGHPYVKGAGEWSPCDDQCAHSGFREFPDGRREAQWRILTVHHLNEVKIDCRWWNLAALCQRCHLTIQGKVTPSREFVREHSAWFKPFAAGWYACRYEDLDLTREEVDARIDELLDHELRELPLF